MLYQNCQNPEVTSLNLDSLKRDKQKISTTEELKKKIGFYMHQIHFFLLNHYNCILIMKTF